MITYLGTPGTRNDEAHIQVVPSLRRAVLSHADRRLPLLAAVACARRRVLFYVHLQALTNHRFKEYLNGKQACQKAQKEAVRLAYINPELAAEAKVWAGLPCSVPGRIP